MMKWWNSIEFVNPELFWLFLLLPLAIAWYLWTRKREQAQVHISSLKGFQVGTSIWARLRPLLFILRLLAIAFIIVALARPQTTDVTTKTKTTEGIDIVLAVDVSASMLAKDLKPDRLEATKEVAIEFIKGRPNDRIGVVVYAGESYTKTPITTDDGIKVYTIGIGTNGNALSPAQIIGKNRFRYAMMPVEIDEKLMKQIASETGGKYYRATNNKKLKEIYEEIDKLEKTEVEEFKFVNKEEKFRILIFIALGLIAFEILLRYTIFKTVA